MRTSAVQHVLDALKKEIQAHYRPGDVLPNERDLSERFGVSRNTVREAMIFLEAYQLVEKTQRGARVRKPSFEPAFYVLDGAFTPDAKTLQDVLIFRRMVEMGSLSTVLAHIQDKDIDAMDEAVDRMEHAMTVHEAAQADHDFHATMVCASGNSVLEQLYSMLSKTLIYYLEIGKSSSKHNSESCAQHRRIIKALRERSLENLQNAVMEHFQYSESVSRESFKSSSNTKSSNHHDASPAN